MENEIKKIRSTIFKIKLFALFTICFFGVNAQDFRQSKQLVKDKLSEYDNNICCAPFKTFNAYHIDIIDDEEDDNYLYLEGVAKMKCMPTKYSRYGQGIPVDEMVIKRVRWKAKIRKRGADSYIKSLVVFKDGREHSIYPNSGFQF